jgi:hypothetical protein
MTVLFFEQQEGIFCVIFESKSNHRGNKEMNMKNAVNQSLDRAEVVWVHLLQFSIIGF